MLRPLDAARILRGDNPERARPVAAGWRIVPTSYRAPGFELEPEWHALAPPRRPRAGPASS
ncbi:hypothetical protein [Actinomyces israelii]|uniref:hypothetical protein n=1 Tax=Actinomyces israelii TaxID=1659 RepID=UPI002357E94F|nr:hypothetical protein [Actinomyces israelii]